MFKLVLWCLGKDQAHSFLFTFCDAFIESLCISPEPCERIQVPIFIAECCLFKLSVAVSLCSCDTVVKHLNLISIEYFYWALRPLRDRVVVKAPLWVFKEAETSADAWTFTWFIHQIFLLQILASTASTTTFDRLQCSPRELKLSSF